MPDVYLIGVPGSRGDARLGSGAPPASQKVCAAMLGDHAEPHPLPWASGRDFAKPTGFQSLFFSF